MIALLEGRDDIDDDTRALMIQLGREQDEDRQQREQEVLNRRYKYVPRTRHASPSFRYPSRAPLLCVSDVGQVRAVPGRRGEDRGHGDVVVRPPPLPGLLCQLPQVENLREAGQ
jgi:hypothetical protein